ncbi:MAG TPA: GTPase ObgE [Candidatus Paceibacterota bacterium]|jgi:GTP-binding protein|nr:GTPase ObgE [Candidatus Pacearchaeota archaeon]HRR94611.1 GTPase ObgE [Candidatus Paceibacterota bacterium]HRU20695.1 GTPase ObgE [Candidatus Paceibacterota bacterium]
MLIDDVIIKVKAGDGGKGAVNFSKVPGALGPTGGSGGNGGNIYFVGVSELDALNQFRFRKKIIAENGQNGKSQCLDGANSPDIYLKVPVGTVVHNLTTHTDLEITKVGEIVLAAKGGKGGKGNYYFRSSVNTTPTQAQTGLPGEEFELRLELKMIADIGLVGLPNVGKSSLLKELTNADPKVANYPFTTLEPNLGVYYDLILADIPGLIEGAHTGKGLGIKFLRHIERTKIIFHLISAESENYKIDYQTIRKELEEYDPALLKKPEYIFITKSDLVATETLKERLTKFRKKAVPISIYDYDSIEKVKKVLNKIMAKK